MKAAKDLVEFAGSLVNLKKLSSPLTFEQAKHLIADFGYFQTKDQLLRMENYEPLSRRNRSVYLTCRKWFEMDANNKWNPVVRDKPDANARRVAFLAKFPVGSHFKHPKSGAVYNVVNEFVVASNDGSELKITTIANYRWEKIKEAT